MFVLRAFAPDNASIPAEKWQFSRLPIRIGRHALNDFSLRHSMVSSFHARIEDVDGKLCVRDVGSKNGVFLTQAPGGVPQRVPPNAAGDLALSGFLFFLGWHVRIQVEYADGEAPARVSAKMGTVLGNTDMVGLGGPPGLALPAAAPAPAPTPVAPIAPPGAAGYGVSPTHPPPLGAYPSPSAPPPAPPGSLAPPPGSLPPAPGAYPVGPHPGGWQPPPGPYPSAPVPGGPSGAGGPLRTNAFAVDLPFLALQGLRELAQSLVPGRPLETTGDIVRFITKLHDTVDVFCRCFIPLRQGYAQFLTSLDLQQAAAQRNVNQSRSALALEAASRPEAVAMALLDPREPSVDAPAEVEGILADLMLHQVALLDGVMEGVRALLDELSPNSIDAALAQRGAAGPFQAKHRARWAEFCARFERLSDERQAFAVIFGHDFAEVYRQYWHKKVAEDRGLRTDPPRR